MHPYQRMSVITVLACGLPDTRCFGEKSEATRVHHCLICGDEFTPVSLFQSRCSDHAPDTLKQDSRAAA